MVRYNSGKIPTTATDSDEEREVGEGQERDPLEVTALFQGLTLQGLSTEDSGSDIDGWVKNVEDETLKLEDSDPVLTERI
jgi:hypothetical protein